MAYIIRRTFMGKPGSGGPLTSLIKEMTGDLEAASSTYKWRVLSDYMSGRTDRIAYEVETDDLGAYMAFEQALGEQMADKFEAWFGKVAPLIEYAEVETWQVQ